MSNPFNYKESEELSENVYSNLASLVASVAVHGHSAAVSRVHRARVELKPVVADDVELATDF